MKHPLRIGTAEAAPGTRADGRIEVSRRPGGGELAMPVVVVNGVDDGPVLWIDGCIHGDEPEGPLSIQMLLERIDPGRLRGALVCVPVVNVAAFEAQQRGDPADGFTYDMNRNTPGKPDGYPSERVAHARTLADAFENVLRNYRMVDGESAYAERWQLGVQRTKLAEIRDLHGRVLEEIRAPADGQVFGTRTMPSCRPGDWAGFFGEVQETLDERVVGR